MNFVEDVLVERKKIQIQNKLPHIGQEEIIARIIEGLNQQNKYISSIFFYDKLGSQLFEDITSLPEYYPTRTEKEILQKSALENTKDLYRTDIIELGSGDCSKISILLENMTDEQLLSCRYVPVDISLSAIKDSASILSERFPTLEIQGIVADFIHQLDFLPSNKKRLFCFFGSTLGNFKRAEGLKFLSILSCLMNPGDALLLGLDRVKDVSVLEKAYNDNKGVTAAFNLNILNVVNALIGSNFQIQNFEHFAFYNKKLERIEMHLKATKDMEITCPYLSYPIKIVKGETIHTENSHKYSENHIQEISSSSNLLLQSNYSDEKNWFSLLRYIKLD